MYNAAPKVACGCSWQERMQRWGKVGIMSLREEQLLELPSQIWKVEGIRCADLGGNRLSSLPSACMALTSLQKLRLSYNQLSTEGIPWQSLAAMPQLNILALDHNRCLLQFPLPALLWEPESGVVVFTLLFPSYAGSMLLLSSRMHQQCFKRAL